MLYVDKGSCPSMYGMAFDSIDNLYFCDWNSPGNIYYLDFRLWLTYRFLDGNEVPLNGAEVSAKLPNGTALADRQLNGPRIRPRILPGSYDLSVRWQNATMGSFRFNEVSSVNRGLQCNVFDAKLTAKGSPVLPLGDCLLDIGLPNVSSVRMNSAHAGWEAHGDAYIWGSRSQSPSQ